MDAPTAEDDEASIVCLVRACFEREDARRRVPTREGQNHLLRVTLSKNRRIRTRRFRTSRLGTYLGVARRARITIELLNDRERVRLRLRRARAMRSIRLSICRCTRRGWKFTEWRRRRVGLALARARRRTRLRAKTRVCDQRSAFRPIDRGL